MRASHELAAAGGNQISRTEQVREKNNAQRKSAERWKVMCKSSGGGTAARQSQLTNKSNLRGLEGNLPIPFASLQLSTGRQYGVNIEGKGNISALGCALNRGGGGGRRRQLANRPEPFSKFSVYRTIPSLCFALLSVWCA